MLHTWDQQLRPHFHVHGLIPSGALSEDGTRWIAGGAKLLFLVRALSKKFRGKFLDGFKRLLGQGELRLPREYAEGEKQLGALVRRLNKKSWVVYSKPPFAGPAKLLDYLSRYTHRVAISNERLIDCRDGQVTFSYRDRSDGDRKKLKKLPAVEFIARFLTHVLPDSFMRIRHYGFLSNRNRKDKLAKIRELLGARAPQPQAVVRTTPQWLETVLGIEPTRCPQCGGQLSEQELRPTPPPPAIRCTAASGRERTETEPDMTAWTPGPKRRFDVRAGGARRGCQRSCKGVQWPPEAVRWPEKSTRLRAPRQLLVVSELGPARRPSIQ